MNAIEKLSDDVREIAYNIHVYLGHGYLEKVYETALVNRLLKAGFSVKHQHPVKIYDEDGTLLGEYFADLLVDDRLIIELKACEQLTNAHIAQTLHYLKATKINDGLLINFGSYKFQIRKLTANYKTPSFQINL